MSEIHPDHLRDYTCDQGMSHVREWHREITRRSDELSPMLKRVMERFWRRLDEVDAECERRADEAGGHA
jgi:hypothetical protein